MLLAPSQVGGWQSVPPDIDPAIFRRCLITWRGCKPVTDVPDGTVRIELPDSDFALAESSLHDVVLFGVVERVRDIVAFWRHLYKVCANGCIIRLHAAYWSHIDVASDPTRLRGISERSLAYLSANGRLLLKDDPYEDGVALGLYDGVDFDVIGLGHFSEPEWEARAESDRGRALSHLLNVSRRVEATLRVYKPSRA